LKASTIVWLSTGSDILIRIATVLALRPCCIRDTWFAFA